MPDLRLEDLPRLRDETVARLLQLRSIIPQLEEEKLRLEGRLNLIDSLVEPPMMPVTPGGRAGREEQEPDAG